MTTRVMRLSSIEGSERYTFTAEKEIYQKTNLRQQQIYISVPIDITQNILCLLLGDNAKSEESSVKRVRSLCEEIKLGLCDNERGYAFVGHTVVYTWIKHSSTPYTRRVIVEIPSF